MKTRWRVWIAFNVVLGLAVLVGINRTAPEYMNALTAKVRARRGGGAGMVPPIQDFLAFVTLFFEDAVSHSLVS